MKSLTSIAVVLVLATGCQNQPGATPDSTTEVPTTAAVFNLAGAPTASLRVPNMHCEFSCVEKVKQVLAEQDGVKEVKIDFPTKTATVAIDEGVFDADVAIAALVDYQFMDSELISNSNAQLASGEVQSAETKAVSVAYEK